MNLYSYTAPSEMTSYGSFTRLTKTVPCRRFGGLVILAGNSSRKIQYALLYPLELFPVKTQNSKRIGQQLLLNV